MLDSARDVQCACKVIVTSMVIMRFTTATDENNIRITICEGPSGQESPS
jgi:hypothetical protein